MYRAAVRDSVKIDWQCPRCTDVHSDRLPRKLKLIDSLGYSYNINERGKASTYWQCTVRPKGTTAKLQLGRLGDSL